MGTLLFAPRSFRGGPDEVLGELLLPSTRTGMVLMVCVGFRSIQPLPCERHTSVML